jgi:hypothetical protein
VTANFEYEWTETFGTFYEVVYQFAREDPRGDIVLLNTGVTYLLNRNLQLDAATSASRLLLLVSTRSWA